MKNKREEAIKILTSWRKTHGMDFLDPVQGKEDIKARGVLRYILNVINLSDKPAEDLDTILGSMDKIKNKEEMSELVSNLITKFKDGLNGHPDDKG